MLFPLRDFRPSSSFPWVTISIIAIDILIFLYQAIVLGDNPSAFRVQVSGQIERLTQFDLFLFQYGVTPCEILQSCRVFPPSDFPVWTTLFTSMFLHGDLFHLISNMWFLWIFGDNVEDSMGKLRFLLFYLIAGLAAAMAQVLIDTQSGIPMIGASGAIAGVLGAYMLLFPLGRILTLLVLFIFVQFIELPAILVLGLWFVLQVVSSMLGSGALHGGGVAFMAHIGGFLAGALLVRLFVKMKNPPSFS